MNSDVPNSQDQGGASARAAQWVPWVILGTICALVIGFFAWSARPGWLEIRTWHVDDAYYNLLVRGFRAGQLNLKAEAPAGLAQLADPYDPNANASYRKADGHPLWDLSYYHGKLYLYFGVTPALVLFWPYAALTGHYLGHKDAVVVFCAVGFLASVGLLCLMWRRYFPEVGLAVMAAGTLALGLAGLTPIILPRANVHEVAISCGYALTMLTLLALWGACHKPDQRWRWLAAASLAYGLAIGARPTGLFGAVILLVPVVQAWWEGTMQKEEGRILLRRTGNLAQSQILVLLLAATGPITCIGLGLLLYNTLRFDHPWEFGVRYQLAGEGAAPIGHVSWSLHYLGFNSWVYFLGPVHWGARFPFVQDIKLPPLPAGYGGVEHPFGVLTNIPLIWLTVAAPLAWRGRSADARCILRGFLMAVALVFATRTLTLGFFRAAAERYEWEFCPALVLLAVVGILGLEHALVGRPAWRRAARWTWGFLLIFSLAFNLLASAILHAEYHWNFGNLLLERGRVNEAIAHFKGSLMLQPGHPEAHNKFGTDLLKKGQTDEAIRQFQEAIHLKPDYADAHHNFGAALSQKGRTEEAISQYQETIRLNPASANAHSSLGAALHKNGQTDEAIRQLQEAIRLEPNHAEAHYNLGVAFYQQGRTAEAVRQFQDVIRLKPDHAQAHNNLGTALGLAGQTAEAIHQFQEALRLKPDYAEARKNLDILVASNANPSPPAGASTNR